MHWVGDACKCSELTSFLNFSCPVEAGEENRVLDSVSPSITTLDISLSRLNLFWFFFYEFSLTCFSFLQMSLPENCYLPFAILLLLSRTRNA